MRSFWKYLSRFHKWAGLILGVQICVWFLSGFIMSLFPIDEVRGRHIAAPLETELSTQDLVPIEHIMALYSGELSGARLTMIAGTPAYILSGDQGEEIIDAYTGHAWQPLEKNSVISVAQTLYKGEGCLLYTSPSPRDQRGSRMPSSA